MKFLQLGVRGAHSDDPHQLIPVSSIDRGHLQMDAIPFFNGSLTRGTMEAPGMGTPSFVAGKGPEKNKVEGLIRTLSSMISLDDPRHFIFSQSRALAFLTLPGKPHRSAPPLFPSRAFLPLL